MKFLDKMATERDRGWATATRILGDWEHGQGHLDELVDLLDPGHNRWLVKEVFRNWLPVEKIIMELVGKTPRPAAMRILRLATAECLARDERQHARIVHHAVESAREAGLSKAECSFVNAVLRNMLRKGIPGRKVHLRETHPDWLVEHWSRQFGEAEALQLIEWNQRISTLSVSAASCPEYAEPTSWKGYYRVKTGRVEAALSELRQGLVYAQDPFARIPVGMLTLKPGGKVLDLCAAPGGKTRLLSDAVGARGQVVAVDRPGQRFVRLRDNIQRFAHSNVSLCDCALEDLTVSRLERFCGSTVFPSVLIDVPCSNTGVIQRRPDVKLKLRPGDIEGHAGQQFKLLVLAARFVVPGGQLVYSTCSVEREENIDVVESFLQSEKGWSLSQSEMSYPWVCGHDGGGAFLLTRNATE